MRQPVLAKCAPSHAPAAGRSGKCQRQGRIFVRFETRRQSKISGLFPQEFIDRFAQKVFPRAIHQPEASLGIKSENGHIDFGHDGAKKRGCFEGAQALNAQRFTKRIDFEQHFAERVILAGSPRANRVITLTKGGQQVGHGLQWPHDVFAGTRHETGKKTDDYQSQGPLHFGGVIAEPENAEGDDRSRRNRSECQPRYAILMRGPATRRSVSHSPVLAYRRTSVSACRRIGTPYL
jgi:hypothetical protein